MKPITRRQFLKKTGLATAVDLIGLTNSNEVRANNQPPRKRIYCHAISRDYAIPESKQSQKENKIPLIFKEYWFGEGSGFSMR